MIKIPNLNKQNWKKNLKELDVYEFPSLPNKLKEIRGKLLKKEKISVLDDVVGFATFKKYFEEFSEEINENFIRNIDFDKFSHLPPLPHQIEGVKFLLKKDGCILADTMGKGKTLQSIYAALLMDQSTKILIVSTKSLKWNFAEELSRLTDDYSVIEKKWIPAKFVLIHYDGVKKYSEDIINFAPDVIICDEAHEIKNLKAGKSKNIYEIIKKRLHKKIWLLTGTPIANRPLEFFSLLKLINHPLSKNWESYILRYCDAYKDNFDRWVTKGASNLKELHELTKDIMLRRINKKGELPDWKREAVYFDMDNETLERYKVCVEEFEKNRKEEIAKELEEEGLSSFAANYTSNEVTKIVVKRLFCAIAKIESENLKKFISEKLKEDPTNKIIVFTNYINVVNKVKEQFGDICVKLDGTITDAFKRQEVVNNFNKDENLKVLVCNLKIGSTGYNIQSANIIIVNDMDWVPNTMLQAECRAWRFGQKRAVSFYYLLYKNSIDELLYDVIQSKMQVVSELLDGTKEEYFETEEGIKLQTEFENISKDDILKEIFAQLK